MGAADHDLHTLAGAFVLDAVSDQERSAFAAHLAGCAECRDEIRELREAAGMLGSAEYVWPRPELRGETIRAAARTTQLAPPVQAAKTAGAAGTEPSGRPRTSGRPRPSGRRWPSGFWRRPAGPLIAATVRLMPKIAAAAVAVAVAGAVVFGVVMHDAMRTLHHSQRQDQLITAVLGAPDAVMRSARVGQGMARVVMSHREHMAVFTAFKLPALPAAERYELWLMGPMGDREAGMLRIGKGGMAGPAVIRGMIAGDMIGLTVEPAGGSALPTSAPVVLIGP